jgi:hypothetical protein
MEIESLQLEINFFFVVLLIKLNFILTLSRHKKDDKLREDPDPKLDEASTREKHKKKFLKIKEKTKDRNNNQTKLEFGFYGTSQVEIVPDLLK